MNDKSQSIWLCFISSNEHLQTFKAYFKTLKPKQRYNACSFSVLASEIYIESWTFCTALPWEEEARDWDWPPEYKGRLEIFFKATASNAHIYCHSTAQFKGSWWKMQYETLPGDTCREIAFWTMHYNFFLDSEMTQVTFPYRKKNQTSTWELGKCLEYILTTLCWALCKGKETNDNQQWKIYTHPEHLYNTRLKQDF